MYRKEIRWSVSILFLAIFFGNQLCGNAIPQNSQVEDDEHLLVGLPNGKIRGKLRGNYYSYESIPYAEPPVDELRFEAPLPYTTKWAGVRDASRKPVACMQWDQFSPSGGEDKLHGVEDCLTVNVYKPTTTIHSKTLPVLILIHGGAFMFGSAEEYSHELIMRRQSFVVVKMNYRLGPLGFLSTEDDVIPGNYGLKDQRLALQWIKSNIAYFGGDPERMIVVGFSAGGAAVHLHCLQRNFTGFVQAAASFSGTAFNPWVVQRNSRARAFELAKNLNCSNVSSAKIKQCLKSKPASDIVRGVGNFFVFGYNPFTTFGPVVEPATVKDAFLTQSPGNLVTHGETAQVPWLVSYSAQDGGYNAAELLQLLPRRGEMINALNERWFDVAPYALFFKDTMTSVEQLDDHSMALKKKYLGDKEFSVETYSDVQRMYTDILFKNGVEKALRLHSQYSRSPIYAYVYDNPPAESVSTILAQRKDIKFGTTHGEDFYLIFQNHYGLPVMNDDSKSMSDKFIKMLEDFVMKGDELKFGDCKFVDNVDQENLQLLKIMKDECENLSVKNFP